MVTGYFQRLGPRCAARGRTVPDSVGQRYVHVDRALREHRMNQDRGAEHHGVLPGPHRGIVRELVPQRTEHGRALAVRRLEEGVQVRHELVPPADGVADRCVASTPNSHGSRRFVSRCACPRKKG